MEETNVTEKQALKISINPPVLFDSVADVAITTTNELGKVINDIFAQVFADYFGCTLECQYQPKFMAYIVVPRLYFHVLPANKYEDPNVVTAFKPLSASFKNGNNSMLDSVIKLSKSTASVNGVKVEITEEGKSVLEDFIVGNNVKTTAFGNQTKEFDWNSAFNTDATETETFIRVFKLDIIKFLKKIYGSVDENGSEAYYQITPTYAIGQQQYKASMNWAINILRLSKSNQDKASELLGWGVFNTNDLSSNIIKA